ncbi:hypothetical protein AVEN_179230-1 [Araneus ventricosus]|uniref:Uncharacterized protein n=1 Tax=Araneus ventricosus TaxID=182803 RepID=A0A4Y2C7I5_ARAVE|nr:hypothetical protein AVEN_179230-1 [Araneus ventricosus]
MYVPVKKVCGIHNNADVTNFDGTAIEQVSAVNCFREFRHIFEFFFLIIIEIIFSQSSDKWQLTSLPHHNSESFGYYHINLGNGLCSEALRELLCIFHYPGYSSKAS